MTLSHRLPFILLEIKIEKRKDKREGENGKKEDVAKRIQIRSSSLYWIVLLSLDQIMIN
jgi:hypothetical protein